LTAGRTVSRAIRTLGWSDGGAWLTTRRTVRHATWSFGWSNGYAWLTACRTISRTTRTLGWSDGGAWLAAGWTVQEIPKMMILTRFFLPRCPGSIGACPPLVTPLGVNSLVIHTHTHTHILAEYKLNRAEADQQMISS
jgi:hypothetical protein